MLKKNGLSDMPLLKGKIMLCLMLSNKQRSFLRKYAIFRENRCNYC